MVQSKQTLSTSLKPSFEFKGVFEVSMNLKQNVMSLVKINSEELNISCVLPF